MRVTVQKVLDAVEEVADRIPGVTVVHADCHGRAWLVDPDSDTIYVNPRQSTARWAKSALDAIDALCDHHQMARPGQVLRLVPAGPISARMTGTGD